MSTKLSDVQPAPIDWIWPQFLARSMLTILEGMPGEGKGLITLDASARVTKGWPFPPNPDAMLPPEERPVVREPAGVILISGEDSRTHTDAPRASVAGANLSRITLLPVPAAAVSARVAAQELADRLLALAQEEPVGLIIIDPMEDAIPGLSTCDASTVRALLRPLINASSEIGAALCGIRQTSVTSRSGAPPRGIGCLAASSVARFIFQVTCRRSLAGMRILACAKSNICEPPPSLAFDVVSAPLGELTSARVDWIGLSAELPGDPAHSSSQSAASAVARAELFLLERLSEGPQPTLDLLQAADRAGLSEASLWRARTALRVKSVKGKEIDGKWSWSLPQKSTSNSNSNSKAYEIPPRKAPGLCPVGGCTAQSSPQSRFCADHQPSIPHEGPVCLEDGCPEPRAGSCYYCEKHTKMANDLHARLMAGNMHEAPSLK